MQVHEKHAEPWRVTLVETGEDTQTGGRLKSVRDYIGDETFCFTYGDGVSNINIQELIAFHRAHGKPATITAIQPPGRYGALNLENDLVAQFQEKPAGDGSWINGGFFVLEPEVFDLIEGPSTAWEGRPLKQLAVENNLQAYRHRDFWKAMDTLRDKVSLEELWQSGNPPWKVWP
jgi:glucose-1-phosphate cytidylyltransferase